MDSQKLARRISRWVLAFVCSLVLFALLALGVLKVTLFNQEFMVKVAHQSEYATKITKEINTSIADLGRGSNVPPEILDDTVPESLVASNIDSFIRGIYTDVPFNMTGKETVEGNIDEAITAYAQKQNLTMDDATNKAVANLKTSSLDIFTRSIEIPYIQTYGKKVMAYNKTLTLLMVLSGAVALLLLIGVMVLMGRWWHRRLRYLSYVLGGSGLMLTALPTYIYFSGTIDRLGLTSESLYRFLTTYVKEFIKTFIVFGGALIALAILIWLISEALRRQMVRGKKP